MIHNLNKKNYLLLGNYKVFFITLLFVGVFLFPKTAFLSSITPEKIIELTNIERMDNKLNVLNANQYLAQAAYNKALDIFKHQEFEHNINGNKFSSWIREVDYQYRFVGENLAIDFITSEGVMEAWKNSPSHYKNVINDKFTEIGVAVLEDKFNRKNSILVVQIFGTPLNANISSGSLTESKDNVNNLSVEGIAYLTHTNYKELELATDREIFLSHDVQNSFSPNISNDNQHTKIFDLIFTLAGFIYLGAFKLINLKNFGL